MTAVLLIVFRALRAPPSLAGPAQPPMEPSPGPAAGLSPGLSIPAPGPPDALGWGCTAAGTHIPQLPGWGRWDGTRQPPGAPSPGCALTVANKDVHWLPLQDLGLGCF